MALAADVPAAQTTDTRAHSLFESAAERFRQGHFREAIELLDEADRLKPSAVLHYNKARAYEGLGERETAVAEYEKYLAMDPAANDRGAVQARIGILKNEIEARARLEREEKARSDASARASPPELRPSVAPSPSSPTVIPWVVIGAGVATLGVGTYFGLRADSEADAGNRAESQLVARDKQDTADTAALVANLAWITGAALVVGGTAWALLARGSKRASSIPISFASSRVELGGRF